LAFEEVPTVRVAKSYIALPTAVPSPIAFSKKFKKMGNSSFLEK
jgi:hypothetical protein